MLSESKIKALKLQCKALFLKQIIQIEEEQLLHDAINARLSLSFEKNQVTGLTMDEFLLLQGAIEDINDAGVVTLTLPEMKDEDGNVISVKRQYTLDQNRINQGNGMRFVDRTLKDNASYFQKLAFEAALAYALALGTVPVQQFRLDQSPEDILKYNAELDELWGEISKELEELGAKIYLEPKLNKLPISIDEIKSAANVIEACDSQIRADHVPEAFQPLVYELVDQTAQYLTGKGDSEKFLNVVSDLMPLQHTVGGIVVGAALIFAGLALAAFSIMLAIQSFGISTPLSLLGIKVAVSMVVAGVAIGSAVVGVTTASVVTGGFFAGKFKVPTETEITKTAQNFAKYHEENGEKAQAKPEIEAVKKSESLVLDNDCISDDGVLSPGASL